MRKRKRKNKKTFCAGMAAAMVSLSLLPAQRAAAVTTTLPILANLVGAVGITLNRSLNFGTLAITDEYGGSATIDPLLNKLFVDGNSSLTSAGGEPSAGRLLIRGAVKPVTVSMEKATVRLTNGASYLEISDFNFQTLKGGSAITVTATSTDDPLLLSVGATLKTRPGQVTGTYIGSNKIFANFQ